MYKFEADGQTIKAKFWIAKPSPGARLRVMKHITAPFYRWRKTYDGRKEYCKGVFKVSTMYVADVSEIPNGYQIIDLAGNHNIYSQFGYQHQKQYPSLWFGGNLGFSDYDLELDFENEQGILLVKLDLFFPTLTFQRLRYYHNLQDE